MGAFLVGMVDGFSFVFRVGCEQRLTRTRSLTAGDWECGLHCTGFHKVLRGIKQAGAWLHRKLGLPLALKCNCIGRRFCAFCYAVLIDSGSDILSLP